MARDIIFGATKRNWSRPDSLAPSWTSEPLRTSIPSRTPIPRTTTGALPLGATGYAPTKWWKPDEAESHVAQAMRGTWFSGPLTREQAEKSTLAFMQAQKIGLMAGAADTTLGSWLLPLKDQQRLYAKLDDVRYDMRKVGGRVAIAIGCLGAAVGMFAIASVYRTAATTPQSTSDSAP